MATVSVIIPVYKVEEYLCECIDSLLVQTYSDFDLVLVDDGSPDRCGEICDDYAKRNDRIHVLHQLNQGLSAARNAGIEYALEKLDPSHFVFVDSDDYVAPGYIEELVRGSAMANGAAAVGFARVYESGKVCQPRCHSGWSIVDIQDYWCSSDALAVVAWGKIYPKWLFDGVRFPCGRIHEDVFTTHQLLFKEEQLAVSHMPLYFYRQRSQSICNRPWTFERLDQAYGLVEQCAFLRERGFERAYVFVRAKLLGELSSVLKRSELSGTERFAEVEKILEEELKRAPVNFWINRAYYRNTMRCGYSLRWIAGMLHDFIKTRSRSWLVNDAADVLKELWRSLR